jgi:hypothetical protein
MEMGGLEYSSTRLIIKDMGMSRFVPYTHTLGNKSERP